MVDFSLLGKNKNITYLSNTAVMSAGWSLVIISIHADSMLEACCGSNMNVSSKSSSLKDDESMTKELCNEVVVLACACVEGGARGAGGFGAIEEKIDAMEAVAVDWRRL